MTPMNTSTGRLHPMPMPGLSKRAQEMLKPRKNQIVLQQKGQADKTRQLMKASI